MAKTQWVLLFITFINSCISVALFIVCISTPEWVTSTATLNLVNRDSEINYGLFSGTLTRYQFSNALKFELNVICAYDEGVCIYSCQLSQEERENELSKILKRETLTPCRDKANQNLFGSIPDKRLYLRQNLSGNDEPETSADIYSKCINPGVWLTTVIFLSLAIVFTALSAIMSVGNVVYNPVEPILGIFGLYICNGISVGCSLMTLILWGALYDNKLKDNVAITDTLRAEYPFESKDLAKLGFSYWLLFLPLLLCTSNIGILITRTILVDKEPPPPTITVAKSDFTLMLY